MEFESAILLWDLTSIKEYGIKKVMINPFKQAVKKIFVETERKRMASENKSEEQEILKRVTREQLEDLRKKGLSIPVVTV